MRWIGYALLIFMAGGLCASWDLAPFYDVPSLAIMIFGLAGVLFVAMERDLWKALRAWWLRDDADPAGVRALEAACRLAAGASWALGVFGVFTGVVIMLKGGVDDYHKWTAGAAVALLTVVYAPVFSLFFKAHETRARRWLDARKNGDAPESA